MRPTSIFVSYSHGEEAWCTEFVDLLKGSGLNVWFDRQELDHQVLGENLERVLSTALDASEMIIMVYSSVSREPPWVAWKFLRRQDNKRLVINHDTPVGMIGAVLRAWANYGVYDAHRLSGKAAARAFIPNLDRLELIGDDILQGLLKRNPRADALWQLNGYKSLTN